MPELNESPSCAFLAGLFTDLQQVSHLGADVHTGVAHVIGRLLAAGLAQSAVWAVEGDDGLRLSMFESALSPSDESLIAFFDEAAARGEGILDRDALRASLPKDVSARLSHPLYTPAARGALLWDAQAPWSAEAVSMVQSVAGLFAVALQNAALFRTQEDHHRVFWDLLEKLDANIYISKLDTCEILFINRKMREEFHLGESGPGLLCWKVLQSDMAGPCPFCPAYFIQKMGGVPYVWEEHNSATGKYYRNSDCLIEWFDGSKAHLQHSMDITEEKIYIHMLSEAKQLAEQANQAKSDFLSRMSHEIRTPISGILGMARIAEASQDLNKVADCLQKITLSARQLLSIVNDVLDISKIEAEKFMLVDETFDLGEVLVSVLMEMLPDIRNKGHRVDVMLDRSLSRYCRGDPQRLGQVMGNLLSNAVKFTQDNGHIILRVREKSRDAKTAGLEFEVEDNGIGIPKDRMKLLFHSFEQVDGGMARRYGGSGLGLYLCKKIVSLMGGSITARSEEGAGSVFSCSVLLSLKPGHEPIDVSRFPGEIRVQLTDSDTRESQAPASSPHMPDAQTITKEGMLMPQDEQGAPAPRKPEDIPEMAGVIDMEQAVSRIMGNRKLYAKLLKSFVESQYMKALHEELDRGDTAEAARTAHTIKGICANLSLTGMHESIVSLESLLKNGDSFDEELKDLDAVSAVTETLIAELIQTL